MKLRVNDNDRDEITVNLNGREIRGWSYRDETERRAKMLAAREYVEGFHDGAKYADDDERPDEPSPEEYRRMGALYDAEKAAGLLRPREEIEADLIDAGRGHLIRRE